MFRIRIFFVLVFVIYSGLCFGQSIRFEIGFDPDSVSIEPFHDYHSVRYMDPEAYPFAKEGEPDIPAYMIRVLIPAQSEITEVIAQHGNRLSLGTLVPLPFQGHHPVSKPPSEFVEPNKNVYESGLIFPSERLIIHSVGRSRGFNILYITYIPFEYDTGSQELYMYTHVSFEVSYQHKKQHDMKDYRANSVFNEMIKSSVINPRDLADFYPEKTEPVRKFTDYDMLIITTDTFLSSAHGYASFRETTEGITSAIKTVSEIESEYSGATVQLKIKTCIFDYVQNNNITYVFLIGDAGTNSTYSVPDQNVYGNVGGYYIDNTIPGDIFYSCFDGQFDWNANGNSQVGEMSVDNADISPDVLIGRLPVRTSQQITDYMNKVETYLGSANNQSFVESLLLSGVILWTSGDAEAKSEKMYNEYIQPYWDFHEKYTLYDSVTTVSIATLSAMLNDSMNFFHMATHGSVTAYSMGTGDAFTSTNALALNNIPGTVITIACTTNAFDPEVSGASDPCLGEAFIRNPNGGSVVYIGASRYGFGTYAHDEHGASFQYNDRIFQHILQDTYNHNIGSAFTQAKIDLVGAANTEGVMRWIHFALNYLGDPSLTAYKEVAGAVAPPSNFSAEGVTTSQIDLSWQKNQENDNVMVIWSTDGVFGTPSDGTVYNAGNTIPGGGTVLYRGSATSCSHTSLSASTIYYYRAFSYNSMPEYSAGRNASAATLCGEINTLPFSENFNASTSLPLCWEIIDHLGNGQVWKFGTIGAGLSGTTGNYAYLNSDGYGSSGSQNTDLVTPVLNLSNYTNVEISFTHYFRQWESSSTATFSYSINSGSTWTQVQSWTSDTSNPAYFSQVIPQTAGQPGVMFKWNYTGSWGYYWCVDDVLIDGDFTGEYYTVSLYADPDDIGVNLTGAGEHASGSNVNISAGMPEGYIFVEWIGDPEDIALLNSPSSSSTFFTMPARNVAFTAVAEEGYPELPVPVYRFFNTIRGGHLYTISEIERDYILEHLPEWSYEGIKFYVFEYYVAGTAHTFRFFNTITGIHLYTISEIERDYIIDNLPEYNYEGVKFYVFDSYSPETTSVYRFFNHVRGGHLYTISDIERDTVMQLPEWTYEGVPFYVFEYYK